MDIKGATSISEAARDIIRDQAVTIPNDVSGEQQKQLLEAVNVMQGSIWEYSDSQPWFLVGLRKNNPTATRQALESMMHFQSVPAPENRPHDARRGTVALSDGDDASLCDTLEHQIMSLGPNPEENKKEGDEANGDVSNVGKGDANEAAVEGKKKKKVKMSVAEEMLTNHMRFAGSPETKIVIRKTVELIGDMSKSCELVFHAVRACARFLTYPTPSVPSDNFVFGHVKGWFWLIYKGFSHFSYDRSNSTDLDICLKTFRKEMSLLAKEANACASDFNKYMSDLKKLNLTIVKEAKFLRKKHKKDWQAQVDRYFHFVDDVKTRHHLLVDITEDRFFPTDWIFEPHPSQTKFHWDFFHFQWVDLKRDWVDAEFEVRSDYSLHWTPYTGFPPNLQMEIVVHLIQHAKAIIEECHQFHKLNFQLSFDSQEIKFLKFAVEEISKLRTHRESVEFITSITKKLFEDLAVLEKVCVEYKQSMEWIVEIIEPCYHTMNRWLADELILPLEYPARRKLNRKCRLFCGGCFRQKSDFLELFGEPLKVVLLRSPISIEQRRKFFPLEDLFECDDVLPSSAINSYGVSAGYISSIFDAGLGRDAPLPIHHPIPKYKKRREQKYNIFDIHRLIEATMECVLTRNPEFPTLYSGTDVDIEKYLVLMEEVQRFLAVFSTIYSFLMVDLKERMEVLESLIYNNLPEHYGTLVKMIMYEQNNPVENQEKSGVKAFGRLHKIFQFIVLFLEKADNIEDSDITYYSSKWAYFKSYAKVQGWIYQKYALFSMYSLPSKKDMFLSLFSDKTSSSEVERIIAVFLEHGKRLIDTSENIFKLHNINIQ